MSLGSRFLPFSPYWSACWSDQFSKKHCDEIDWVSIISVVCVSLLFILSPEQLVAENEPDLKQAEALLVSDPANALSQAERIEVFTPQERVLRSVIMARAHLLLGDGDAASQALAATKPELVQVSDLLHSRWLQSEATLLLMFGRYDESMRSGRKAWALLENEGSPSDRAEALAVVLQATLAAGNYSEALGFASQLQQILSEPGIDTTILFDAHMTLGRLHQEFSDQGRARQAFEAAAEVASENGDTVGEADARYSLAQLLVSGKRFSDAAVELEAVDRLYADVGDEFGLTMVSLERARVAIGQGDFDQAYRLASRARQQLSALGVPVLVRSAVDYEAEALIELGQYEQAMEAISSLSEAYPDLPPSQFQNEIEARAAAGLGDWEEAYQAARAQIELERSNADQRLSQASERARARLDFETAKLQRSQLQGELRMRDLEIEAARRQAFWQRAAILLTVGVLALSILGIYRLRRQRKEVSELAMRDYLTGLYNRRAFYEFANSALAEARRANQPISLLIIDLDHFKSVNDEHGHDVGDKVLAEFSEMLRGMARSGDFPARIGGEEFALMLPDTDGRGAMLVAERLVDAVQTSGPYTDGLVKNLSTSIGVAELEAAGSLETLMKRADAALYRAKRSGRGRAELSD